MSKNRFLDVRLLYEMWVQSSRAAAARQEEKEKENFVFFKSDFCIHCFYIIISYSNIFKVFLIHFYISKPFKYSFALK